MRYFVVILTPDALSSSYVEREVLQAQKQNKIIVPCIHEHVEYNEIKWGLQENQGIEFSDRYELALNLYPKIKNYKNVENKKPSFVPQQITIQDTDISGDVDALNKKGNDLYDQVKSQEAIDYYDKVLKADPNNESVRYKKFLALEHLSKEKPSSYNDTRSKGLMPKGWKPPSEHTVTAKEEESSAAPSLFDPDTIPPGMTWDTWDKMFLENQGKSRETLPAEGKLRKRFSRWRR